jgi:hypothetical protein
MICKTPPPLPPIQFLQPSPDILKIHLKGTQLPCFQTKIHYHVVSRRKTGSKHGFWKFSVLEIGMTKYHHLAHTLMSIKYLIQTIHPPKQVMYLFLNCTDALCCSSFFPKTYLSSLFSQALVLPFYPALQMFVDGERIHLVILPLGVQKMGMAHHCRYTKGWQQKEMDCK